MNAPPALDRTTGVAVARAGREREPVVIADDFCADEDNFVADAARRRFDRVGPYYPGVRAEAPSAAVEAVIARADPLVRAQFTAGRGCRILCAYYSLVTTPPAALQLAQRVPHYDGVERERLALLLYLGPARLGGTAFYRHRATGFETVTRARLTPYLASLQAQMHAQGAPPPAYIAGDTPLYARTLKVDARPNRMLVYRGNLLHCADIPDAAGLSADPREGRLTLNVFLMAQAIT